MAGEFLEHELCEEAVVCSAVGSGSVSVLTDSRERVKYNVTILHNLTVLSKEPDESGYSDLLRVR
jgi:hypothetical protein